jgi:peptide/nickel transport system substrate-binding protein
VHEIQKLCAEDLPAIALYYPDYYYAASDKTEWYFTKEGIANGLRLPLNKLSLIRDSSEPASAETEVDAPEESTSEPESEAASAAETPMLPALAVLSIVFAAYRLRR